MNKKGFTLIEVIGVVTVLALIIIVAVPSLTKTLKRNEQNKYNDYIDNLKIAAENYVVDKLKEGERIEESTEITLGDLIDAGYVKNVVTNPANEGKLSRNAKIKVSREVDGTFKNDFYEHYILPDEYQQVEYIESTGTQYLEIDFIANQDTITKGQYQLTDITSTMLFGSRISLSDSFYGFNWGGSSAAPVYYNSYYTGKMTTYAIDDKPHTLYKNKGKLFIDDNEISTNTPSVDKFTTPYKMIVFGCNTNGTVNLLTKARIYYLQFYDNDILKVDLIPCYRKSDGEIGMFDLKNYKFYTNYGTGKFKTDVDV